MRNIPVESVKGVGIKTAELFNKLGIRNLEDALNAYPRDYKKYEPGLPLSDSVLRVEQGTKEVFSGEDAIVLRITSSPVLKQTKRMPIVIYNHREGDISLEIIWYRSAYIKAMLKKGETFVFCGRLKREGRNYKLEQPSVYTLAKYREIEGKYMPVYPLTKGLSQNTVINVVREALKQENSEEDFLSEEIMRGAGLSDRNTALASVHFPDSLDELKFAYRRLAFEELFLFALAMRFEKQMYTEVENKKRVEGGEFVDSLMRKLPYELTGGQKKALSDIFSDMSSTDKIMHRLVQGDVGSGKTIVAFLAMAAVCENGYQSAMMAPTEVLARQHYENFLRLREELSLDIGIELLCGSMTSKQKNDVYQKMADTDKLIVVGTNALIQKKAAYKNLGLAVIDEQHRFGVRQREELAKKAAETHVLIMSATPIPRTLNGIIYGALDVTVIDELPKNRLPIKNCVVGEDYRNTAYKFIAGQIKEGHQCYIICPLIEASDAVDATNVNDYTAGLKKYFDSDINIASIHGRMSAQEKDAVMSDFKEGKISILVSTTVIEVGVDVPNATVMMIEDSGRFGLAALHQLRGRVGRGESQSFCIFMDSSENEDTRKRLEILNGSNDGFKIAEEDLRLRGPGDFFGIRQSGDFSFRIADIYRDSELLKKAAAFADLILKDDPSLSRSENAGLKMRLEYYFENASSPNV